MKIGTLAFAITSALMCASSCSGTNNSATDDYTLTGTEMLNNGEVERTLKLDNFNGIDASMVVDIHYTQGNQRSVRVRARQELLDKCDISVNGSTLVMRTKRDETDSQTNSSDNKITMYVTAPDIESICNSGMMGFFAKQVDNDALQIRNKGMLEVNVQNLSVRDDGALDIDNSGRMTAELPTLNTKLLSLENSGMMTFNNNNLKGSMMLYNSGRLTFAGNVDGQTAELNNKGMCKMNTAFNLSGNYSCDNSGQLTIAGNVKGATAELNNKGMYTMDGSFSLNGRYTYNNSGKATNNGNVTAQTIDISNSGLDNNTSKLKADRLSMDINGRSDYEMNFSGGDAKLECRGMGDFNLALDCRSLEVNTSGRINVTLSGTADNTSLNSTGISRVNTSKLNNF